MDIVMMIIVGMLGLFVYLLPAYIAGKRHHPQELGVFLLNLAFGWTLIGWVGALIWAVSIPVPVEVYQPVEHYYEEPEETPGFDWSTR